MVKLDGLIFFSNNFFTPFFATHRFTTPTFINHCALDERVGRKLRRWNSAYYKWIRHRGVLMGLTNGTMAFPMAHPDRQRRRHRHSTAGKDQTGIFMYVFHCVHWRITVIGIELRDIVQLPLHFNSVAGWPKMVLRSQRPVRFLLGVRTWNVQHVLNDWPPCVQRFLHRQNRPWICKYSKDVFHENVGASDKYIASRTTSIGMDGTVHICWWAWLAAQCVEAKTVFSAAGDRINRSVVSTRILQTSEDTDGN